MQTRKLRTKVLSRWKKEENRSSVMFMFSLHSTANKLLSSQTYPDTYPQPANRSSGTLPRRPAPSKQTTDWYFLIFSRLFCSFLSNLFVMLKVPVQQASWICTCLSRSPLHFGCAGTVCIIHSYLNWLQFHPQAIVFWQKVSISGLCLLQLSLQFSFILSTSFLEFTQFLLCTLSTREQFQQQNSSSWTKNKNLSCTLEVKKIPLLNTEGSTPFSNIHIP